MASMAKSHDLVGVDRHHWWGDEPVHVLTADLASAETIVQIMKEVKPDVVIHCAAMVSVDACEKDPKLAYASNAEMTNHLVRSVSPSCLFVYITTDGIFDGTIPFVTEAQIPCPRTVYGRSKLHGEWEVQLATANHLIVRTNFYGWSSTRKQTSAEWLFNALYRQEPITLFSDFYFTPLYVMDLVERLDSLILGNHRGIVHVAGRDRVSKYQFGMLLAEAAGLPTASIREGSIDDAPMIASRPKDMSLSCNRFRELTGLDVPSCASGIHRFLADRERPLSMRTKAVLTAPFTTALS
jgi:dTDP-4-dehydrorhamnose reductase